MRRQILCIEDDRTIQTLVEVALKDYDVHFADTLADAEKRIKSHQYSGLILDIHLPDGDGLRFLNNINLQQSEIKLAVFILSDHSEIANKVTAFSLGADDFIGKPFDPIELNVRLTAKIKKNESQQEKLQVRKIGDLLIDFDRQKTFQVVDHQEKDLNLTGIEMKIISVLTKRMEQVYSREQLMQLVWGETFISDRTVDSHIAHLRSKISSSKVLIETSKNFGYRSVLKR